MKDPAKMSKNELRLEVIVLREKMQKAHDELMNLQPHIPQACIAGHEGFIDDHVDAAMNLLAVEE